MKYLIANLQNNEFYFELLDDLDDVQKHLVILATEDETDMTFVSVLEVKTIYSVQPEKFKLIKE